MVNHNSVRIGDREYPSVKAAAEAEGCSIAAIYGRMRRGTLDMRGKPLVMQVRVRNRVYPTAKACAKAEGVSLGTVYVALSRGRPDSIGKASRAARKPA